MKRHIALIAITLLAASLAPVHGSNPSPSVQSSFPPGFAPVEIRRWMRDDHVTWDIVTAPPNVYSPPWHAGGTLGWVSSNQFAGSHALYVCQRRLSPNDLFTSAFEHCEGENRVPMPYLLGYVSSTQIPGTVPLYRCVAGKNEFDSVHAHCEGHAMVGTLGYIFP